MAMVCPEGTMKESETYTNRQLKCSKILLKKKKQEILVREIEK